MSSPIISGLIALSDSGRSSVSVPISPSISIESVFIVGRAGGGGRRRHRRSFAWSPQPRGRSARPRAAPVTCRAHGGPKPDEPGADPVSPEALSVEEQRRRLPDQPGVYLFKDAREGVLYVGKATSIRKRVAGHFSGKSTREAARWSRGSRRSTSS